MVRLCTFERVVCVTYNTPKRYCPPWVVKCDIVPLSAKARVHVRYGLWELPPPEPGPGGRRSEDERRTSSV